MIGRRRVGCYRCCYRWCYWCCYEWCVVMEEFIICRQWREQARAAAAVSSILTDHSTLIGDGEGKPRRQLLSAPFMATWAQPADGAAGDC